MNSVTEMVQVVIIGAGCAGLSAGIYAARADLKPLIFTGTPQDRGGLLVKTSVVENYPGFEDGILGFDLIHNMESQVLHSGTSTYIESNIVEIKRIGSISQITDNVKSDVVESESISQITDKAQPSVVESGFRITDEVEGVKSDVVESGFRITDDRGDVYLTKTIIVATGSKPNKLGLENEDKFWANGISSCAVCDGALYKRKRIVVVGGGDSACEEAQFLTKFSTVALLVRRDVFRASKAMQNKVLTNPKITILYNTVVHSLHGKDRLRSITIKNVVDGSTQEMEVDGLFYGLGLKPNTSMFKDLLDMDEDGYIQTVAHPEYQTMTSVPGIFVAGDCHDKIYRQAIVACGDGCKAAMDVNKYLTHDSS